MDCYKSIQFIKADGSLNLSPCTIINTPIFINHGLKRDDRTQKLDDKTLILSSEYLCPFSFKTRIKRITKNTISIHWFDASWYDKNKSVQKKTAEFIDKVVHIPNRILIILLGNRRYNSLKDYIKN